jgi:hypothetical protein
MKKNAGQPILKRRGLAVETRSHGKVQNNFRNFISVAIARFAGTVGSPDNFVKASGGGRVRVKRSNWVWKLDHVRA